MQIRQTAKNKNEGSMEDAPTLQSTLLQSEQLTNRTKENPQRDLGDIDWAFTLVQEGRSRWHW